MRSIYNVIIKPVLTEKSNTELSQNRYTFQVAPEANKIEIKDAIEKIYKVKVTRVNTVNCKGKSVRMGRSVGKKSDWKKAIVFLAEGQKIEGLVG